MPGPVSRTVTLRRRPPSSSAASVSLPPSGVCRSALAARFCSACSRRLPVGPHREIGRLHVDVERDVAFADRRPVAIGDPAEQLADRHVLDRQRAAAAFEPREIEQIADQRSRASASRRR